VFKNGLEKRPELAQKLAQAPQKQVFALSLMFLIISSQQTQKRWNLARLDLSNIEVSLTNWRSQF
jgi:hypothetical protein